MKCPICNLDLSPLDLISRTEHVDLCIENGPSLLEIGEAGQLVVKKNVHPSKQRKICPICDKTFQNLAAHFKTCAIKNDVPPSLMLEHWDKINADIKNPKKFPRELLDNFVAKCVKEGRLGEQVDFARALALSMSEGEPHYDNDSNQTGPINPNIETSNDSTTETSHDVSNQGQLQQRLHQQSADRLLVRAATSRSAATKKKYRLELVDEVTKQANVELRIDRELAATNSARYREALEAEQLNLKRAAAASDDDDDVLVLDDTNDVRRADYDNSLFYRARLKNCDGSEGCLEAKCEDHDLLLLLDEFKIYSGASMDSAPSNKEQFERTERVQAASSDDAAAKTVTESCASEC